MSKYLTFSSVSFILIALLIGTLSVQAQPSGGPYGPIWQKYDLPKIEGQIYYVAADGKAEESGTSLEKPTTLSAAIERVKTGDAIILRGGIYRTGGLVLNQGITMQPYTDEHPVLKGTLAATQWEAIGNNTWRTSWKTLFPASPLSWWRGNPTQLHLFNNDMVFIDGEILKSVSDVNQLDPQSYFINYEKGQVYIGVNPANRLVEITAFDSAIVRTTKDVHGKTNDRKGPVIRGITFTQYAWRAIEVEGKRSFGPSEEPTDEPVGLSDPATYGKEVTGTTLENVTITFCSRVAGYFRGDKLTIRNSLFSDTSTEGVYVIGSSDVLLEHNIFRRNNIEKMSGYYPAAVKIFNQSHRVTCRDNLVLDNPNSNGVWYDVGNQDGIFINNWIDKTDNGFFFEISKGAICAGNIFVNCSTGIKVLNSSNVQVYQNTLINSRASFERNSRSPEGDLFGWHSSTGPDVEGRNGHVFVNNLLIADAEFNRPLLYCQQPGNMYERLKEPQVKKLDYNVYVRTGGSDSQTLIVWSPVAEGSHSVNLQSPQDLNKLLPEFSGNSLVFTNYNGPLFRSAFLSNYELLEAFPGSKKASHLPTEISKLLGWEKQESHFPGAFPLCP
jgi:hypothetical protein